jgi:hypothetical protein
VLAAGAELASALTVAALVLIFFLARGTVLKPSRLEQGFRRRVGGYQLYLEGRDPRLALAGAEPPEPSPGTFHANMPYAIALGYEDDWGRQFDRRANERSGWRPRWFASEQRGLAPSGLAHAIGTGLTSAFIDALLPVLEETGERLDDPDWDDGSDIMLPDWARG